MMIQNATAYILKVQRMLNADGIKVRDLLIGLPPGYIEPDIEGMIDETSFKLWRKLKWLKDTSGGELDAGTLTDLIKDADDETSGAPEIGLLLRTTLTWVRLVAARPPYDSTLHSPWQTEPLLKWTPAPAPEPEPQTDVDAAQDAQSTRRKLLQEPKKTQRAPSESADNADAAEVPAPDGGDGEAAQADSDNSD